MSLRAVRQIRALRPPETKRVTIRALLQAHLFLYPWKWLGVSHKQWTHKNNTYENRLLLWN